MLIKTLKVKSNFMDNLYNNILSLFHFILILLIPFATWTDIWGYFSWLENSFLMCFFLLLWAQASRYVHMRWKWKITICLVKSSLLWMLLLRLPQFVVPFYHYFPSHSFDFVQKSACGSKLFCILFKHRFSTYFFAFIFSPYSHPSVYVCVCMHVHEKM